MEEGGEGLVRARVKDNLAGRFLEASVDVGVHIVFQNDGGSCRFGIRFINRQKGHLLGFIGPQVLDRPCAFAYGRFNGCLVFDGQFLASQGKN